MADEHQKFQNPETLAQAQRIGAAQVGAANGGNPAAKVQLQRTDYPAQSGADLLGRHPQSQPRLQSIQGLHGRVMCCVCDPIDGRDISKKSTNSTCALPFGGPRYNLLKLLPNST